MPRVVIKNMQSCRSSGLLFEKEKGEELLFSSCRAFDVSSKRGREQRRDVGVVQGVVRAFIEEDNSEEDAVYSEELPSSLRLFSSATADPAEMRLSQKPHSSTPEAQRAPACHAERHAACSGPPASVRIGLRRHGVGLIVRDESIYLSTQFKKTL